MLDCRMSIDHDGAPVSKPAFSIVIPMEFHRGQWEQCWQSWNAQTVERSLYEIILAVSPDFQRQNLLDELPVDRVAFSNYSHDMGLCADGAEKARGEYLIFTEAHCRPEPDALEKCLEAIRENPDWEGFSCQSIPITHNRLSLAEADMYMADIEHAMHFHPWQKILDHCFVTRREAYEACGGFRPEFGHFAEWVLAANFFQLGYKLGYFPKARFHHYYIGTVRELRTFTHDFIAGEVRYFSELPNPSHGLLRCPPEWICQGNFDRRTARTNFNIAVKNLWPPGARYKYLIPSIAQIGRWIPPAISGDRIARACAMVTVLHSRIALSLANAIGSQNWLNARFKKYIAALIAYQRLAVVGDQRPTIRRMQLPGHRAPGNEVFSLNTTGFHPEEQEALGNTFRWSEPAASVVLSIPAGAQKIRIDCIPVRVLSSKACDLRFYFNGLRVPANQIRIEKDYALIDHNIAEPRIVTLSWTCPVGRCSGSPLAWSGD